MPKRLAAAYALLIAVAVGRVAATHRVFSAVIDEPVHIAAGHQWWNGEPAWDALHPPLAKLLFALPYRSTPPPATHDRGAYAFELLYGRPDDIRTLAHARAANLAFLIVGMLAAIVWARRFGERAGLAAAAMLACLPPLLGHAGVATTDMAVAAMLPAALLALDRWLTSRSWRDALLLGAALGLGALSKYSFLLFFPVCAAVMLVVRRRRLSIAQTAAAAVIAIAGVWAGYRFTFAPLSTFRSVTMPPPASLAPPLAWLYTRLPIPAPQFLGGLVILHYYNAAGRAAYLLGEVRQHGWWYYFPVVFFFKTPLPFQLLSIAGIVVSLLRRRAIEVALMPLALMFSVLGSSINIGVRHILPIYPLLAVAAGIGCAALWSKSRVAAAGLMAWLVIGSALAHPNYLGWFNEAAGGHGERIAIDSNLDWGQDMLPLAREARRQHIDHIALHCVSATPFERHGVPSSPLPPFTRSKGWIAVSETALVLDPEARAGGYDWLRTLPYRRVGTSVRLLSVQ